MARKVVFRHKKRTDECRGIDMSMVIHSCVAKHGRTKSLRPRSAAPLPKTWTINCAALLKDSISPDDWNPFKSACASSKSFSDCATCASVSLFISSIAWYLSL
jgi:hypothetical protein